MLFRSTSDAQGAYGFASVMPGVYPLTASKTGYVEANETISVAPVSSATRVLSLQPASSPGSAPRVTGITSKYTGFRYYLDGVAFNVNFTATTRRRPFGPKSDPIANVCATDEPLAETVYVFRGARNCTVPGGCPAQSTVAVKLTLKPTPSR